MDATTADQITAFGGLLIGIAGIGSVIVNWRSTRKINGTPKRVAKIEDAIYLVIEYIEEQHLIQGKELSPRWSTRLEGIRSDMRSGGTGH